MSEILKKYPVLIDLKKEFQEHFQNNLNRIILYGSRARGDASEFSDYDCLLLFNELNDSIKDEIDEVAAQFLSSHNCLFSVVPVLTKEYEERIYNPLFVNIRNEGIIL